MTTIEEKFERFISETRDSKCVWGESDCTAWPAQWLKEGLGIDVGLPKYSSEEEANELIKEAGSLTALWDRYLGGSGLYVTHSPDTGDIGVIQFRKKQVGVIFAPNGLAFLRATEGAICLFPKHCLCKAWAIR